MAVGAIQIIDEIELDVALNVCWCSRPGVGPGENCLSFLWPWLCKLKVIVPIMKITFLDFLRDHWPSCV